MQVSQSWKKKKKKIQNKEHLNRCLRKNHKIQQNDEIQAIVYLGVTRCPFIF